MGRNVKITSGRGATLEMWKERAGAMGVKLDDKVDIAVGSFVEADMLAIRDHLNKAYPVPKAATAPKWFKPDQVPEGKPGHWSADVMGITNLGNPVVLAYFHGDDGGCWQRPSRLLPGEQLEYWLPMPEAK